MNTALVTKVGTCRWFAACRIARYLHARRNGLLAT
jgi:hypothetical protein